MGRQLTAQDARVSLNAHAAATGAEIRRKYGPDIGFGELLRILADRTCVRYPCDFVYDDALLQPGEFAFPAQKGPRPEDGFTLYVHPHFRNQPAAVPLLVMYQLVAVNYGPFASAEDAESFGAAVFGLQPEDYYQQVCRLADQLLRTCDLRGPGH